MSLVITQEMLQGMYKYLKTTPPFRRWNLPDTSEIKFYISRHKREYGNYRWDGKRHTITGSRHAVDSTAVLAMFMSHEMIHMQLEITGKEAKKGSRYTHNAEFKRIAARVCRYHGFDIKVFY